jgi:hypothetical protein
MHYCSLLKIAECVLLVGRYITSRSRREFGAVCQAFADAVRDLLVDWKLYVSSLETDLRANGEWSLIRIMSSCQQVVDPLYTTACAILPAPVLMRLRYRCYIRGVTRCECLLYVAAGILLRSCWKISSVWCW